MTGLSASGKSTIAKALEEALVLRYGKHVQMLDGDNVRTGLNRDLGFSPADRAESVRRVGEMACLFNGGGVITLVTLVSPYRADRDAVRQRHEDQGLKYLEVFMNVPLDIVQERDPKGLYAKAAAGELKGFTGIDAPYEEPLQPDVNLPNWDLSLDECVHMLLEKLRIEGVLDGGPSDASGLPLPPGFTGTWLEDELILSKNTLSTANAASSGRTALDESLPRARLTDIDVNWLHVISEGWAPPLRGFMREGVLLQALHFNSLLIDPLNDVGAKELNFQPTNWNTNELRGRRYSLASHFK
jgi:3'-phosphoadenosine 5'-phosphosulfate synthase